MLKETIKNILFPFEAEKNRYSASSLRGEHESPQVIYVPIYVMCACARVCATIYVHVCARAHNLQMTRYWSK